MVLLVILIATVILVLWKRSKSTKISFGGKHILITGGSSGLGKEIARQLYGEGAKINIVARGVEQLKVTVEEIDSNRDGAINYIAADVTMENNGLFVKEVAESRFGPIDYVFCCAGLTI